MSGPGFRMPNLQRTILLGESEDQKQIYTFFWGIITLTSPVYSITMPCKAEQVLGLAEAIKKAKKDGHGAPVPEPQKSDLYYRAAYNIDPTYRDSMDRWALDFDTTGTSGSIKLDFETAKKTKWSEFGFKNVEGGGGVSFFGLFRIGARGSKRHEYKEVKVNESKSSVSIELSWKQLQFFNVSPGIW